MALYGAFFSGLSGMHGTSQAIASAADNITNSNTVGYKASSVSFKTMVTGSSSKNNYISGGVQIVNRKLVDYQGMIQSTGVVSDIAVSGKGMIVVNSRNDGTGDFLFTRAGSFRQDNLGNFVNAAGHTLMAWQLDNEGRIPGEPGNINTISNALLDSLTPVNLRSLSGAVAATTKVDFSMNLDAGERVLQGAGQTIRIPSTSTQNSAVNMSDILVPNANLPIGATLKINDAANTYTYTYGGLSYSNDVTLGIMGATNATQVFTTGLTNGDKFTISTSNLGTLTYTFTTSTPDVTSGYFNNLATLAQAISNTQGMTARVQNNRLWVSPIDANDNMTFANVGAATMVGSLGLFNVAASAPAILGDGVVTSEDITATPMFGQNTAAGVFVGPTAGVDTLTITTPSGGTSTFTFNSPPGAGQFESLSTLATAINATAGLNANILNGRLSISSDTYTDTITFGYTGTDFPTTLGLADATALPGNVQRFTTLQGLRTMINDTDTIAATTVSSSSANASLYIYNKNPLGIIMYDYGYPLPNATTNPLTEFGLVRNVDTLASNTDLAKGVATIAPTGPAYDPLGITADNMAGGDVVPQFSRNFEVYDPLGARHDFRISFVKVATNVWAAEIYALDPDDIVISSGRTDGMVAYGNITFNGDGSLRNVTSQLTAPITLTWTNGAIASTINLDLGTAGLPAGTVGATVIGLRDGLSQVHADYNVQFVEQNGVSAALLSTIDIDGSGYIIANYSNGLSQKLFQIPLGEFPNYDGLAAKDGNVYASNQEAGAFNLRKPNSGSVGTLQSNALEQANVELADELTKLVVAQRGYEANTQIIKTVNELLRELNRLFT
ncbi:MAG: flagellar hook-basal body complex protein [Sphingobacteriia bacterium]|nr:flagellar hook-basal body complex protein [Sphingobacteriia bacterium]